MGGGRGEAPHLAIASQVAPRLQREDAGAGKVFEKDVVGRGQAIAGGQSVTRDQSNRFQIQTSVRPPGQNAGDDPGYLARGLFLDDCHEVFFSAFSSSAAVGSGRASQIAPFTSISLSLSARNRR